jgi:ParB-like chromosome segregation protein Spo0J
VKKEIIELTQKEKDWKTIQDLRELLHNNSPVKDQPVDFVQWVPVDKIQANDYNPNSVANSEMRLLYISILKDGYTQPIVTIYDEAIKKYVIVDGFHRYFVCLKNKDIYDRNHGMLPVVVLKKDINDRMASTIRHNRARGKHSIKGMSSMAFQLLDNGWRDEDICNELGMEAEELMRLKHITGFSKLFKDAEYHRSWEAKYQIQLRRLHEQNPDANAQELNAMLKELNSGK